jgi:hypothetical protein
MDGLAEVVSANPKADLNPAYDLIAALKTLFLPKFFNLYGATKGSQVNIGFARSPTSRHILLHLLLLPMSPE